MTEEKVFFETKEEHDYQSKEEGWQSLNEELWKRFQEDEGIIRYTLTNDYMFRVFLQENEFILRSYDNLEKGGEYEEVLPAIHVGILDYTLFPEEPEFYATHKLMNVKTHKVYNDKFVLHVLSLKQIKRATEEDKEWHLDKWAALFAAKTWREIKMMAEKNEVLMRAGCELYKMNADDRIREQCQAREDYERHERAVKRQIRELEQALAEKDNEIARLRKMLEEQMNS